MQGQTDSDHVQILWKLKSKTRLFTVESTVWRSLCEATCYATKNQDKHLHTQTQHIAVFLGFFGWSVTNGHHRNPNDNEKGDPVVSLNLGG